MRRGGDGESKAASQFWIVADWRMILAGDVDGAKVHLALYGFANGRLFSELV
jgi:hypothetical protein